MHHIHPFQRLYLLKQEQHGKTILLAAAGSSIISFDAEDGKLLSRWPLGESEELEGDGRQSGSELEQNGKRAIKRRKIDSNGASKPPRQESEESVEIVAERQKGQRRKSKIVDDKAPKVSIVTGTSDGQYLVVATAEDKAIRVLEVVENGMLKQRSIRYAYGQLDEFSERLMLC